MSAARSRRKRARSVVTLTDGHVITAPDGVRGFDADVVLSSVVYDSRIIGVRTT
jgi:hypothetical protein